MPKNGICRSRGRKPLADISNGVQMSRTSKKDSRGEGGASPRDRLLLARADLSKLINQIDRLVVQALEHKFTSDENQEIEAFMRDLSDMHSSLKPWIPRFEHAFCSLAVAPGNQLEPSLDKKTLSIVDGREKNISNGPSKPELGLIVSPSPLVSWHKGACTVESGRQLFLLTPLHESKSVASKFPGSSKPFQERLTSEDGFCSMLGLATFSNAPNSNCGILVEKVDGNPMPNKFLLPESGALDSTSKTDFVSLAKVSNCKDVFTHNPSPCIKTSPLKTCFLLGSLSDSVQQDKKIIRKGTPWIARIQRNDASPVSDISDGNYSNMLPESGALDSTSKTDFVSLAKVSNCKNIFTYNPSPFIKTSPLKTCFLLDSLSDSVQQDNKIIRKGTPWIARTQRNDASPVSDTLSDGNYSQHRGSDEISVTLSSKYPELFGLPPAQNSMVWRKEVDESLDWFLSPPKTCVLMEPSDEKVVLASGREKIQLNSGNNESKLAGPVATPMWMDLEGTAANGRNAGETTLKRELWTKFEAVSMNGLQFSHSSFQQISRNRFLDMLEEVS